MAKRQRGALLRRAMQEAGLQYGPQIRALSELRQDAAGRYRSGVRAARGSAAGIQQAVREARPVIGDAYADSLASAGVAEQDVGAALAGLGAAADPFRAAVAREQGQASTRIGEARAGALSDLARRSTDAVAGSEYRIQDLTRRRDSEFGRINRERKGLAAEIGQFTRATYGELKDAKAELDLENAKFQLDLQGAELDRRATLGELTGIDPATGKRTAAERARQREARGGKGASRGAVSKHQDLIAEVQDAAATVKRLQKAGSEFPSIGQVMTLPKNADNPYGGFGPLVTRAGVELERDGKISRGTLRQLRSRGLLLKRTPRDWRRNPPQIEMGPGGVPQSMIDDVGQ
jgi:hypothetical protein